MKKGFTLIELLAVIAILALIAMIVFPAINSAIKTAGEDAYNNQVKIIENAAKEWGLANVEKLPDVVGGTYNVTVTTLIDEGYISDEDVKDPRDTTKEITGKVIITYESNQYTYRYSE